MKKSLVFLCILLVAVLSICTSCVSDTLDSGLSESEVLSSEEESQTETSKTEISEPTLIPKEDLEYVSNGSEIQINSYKGSGGNVIIPSEIDGVKVTRIARAAFKDCASLTGIHLPDTLTFIDTDAFWNSTTGNCEGVIVLPSSLQELGTEAFGETGFKGMVVKCSITIDSDSIWAMNNLQYIVVAKDAVVVLDDIFRWSGGWSVEPEFMIIPDNGTKIIGDDPFSNNPSVIIYTPKSSYVVQQAKNYFVTVNSEDFEAMYDKYMIN